FTRTLEALDLLNIIVTRDSNGAVIDPNDDIAGDPGPIATRAAVYARILKLLDDGQTDLQAQIAGGAAAKFASIPIKCSPTVAGFDSPATFLQFNRALRARATLYNCANNCTAADYNAALAALAPGVSFLNTGSPLTTGVYYSFSTNSGDKLPSPLVYDPTG